MKNSVIVAGGGLAGCEAAYQLAKRSIPVKLYDMKPHKKSPAHVSDSLCELVCSNSLRSDRLENAAGLLKEELRALDSIIMRAADETRIPAGGALAVDRETFPATVTKYLEQNPYISIINEEIKSIPDPPAIIATGPLTDGDMYRAIEDLTGSVLHFYDAAAPVVYASSLDMDIIFRASRYERGSDYLNCPMNREQYLLFWNELINAKTVELESFENPRVFEGCMPIETMAKRGERTLSFGPMKPVGLHDERTGKRPYAVVQLRQDDASGSLYNIVGFQTNLTFSEQRRVFGLIPGLGNAEYARYGVMHRNTFLRSPGLLDDTYMLKQKPLTYFAGQITGVEGYVESAASGLLAGISLSRRLKGLNHVDFPNDCAIGALGKYVSEYCGHDFQPMNISFGIMKPLSDPPGNKREKNALIAKRALERIETIKAVLQSTSKGE